MRRILFIVLLALPSFCFAQAGADKVRMLVDTLERDSDYKVRIAAAQALSQIADGSVADWMIRAFRKDDNDAVRLTILYAISEIPDERILSPLIELANQEVLSGKERMVIEQTIWNFREIFNTSSWIAAAINSNDIQIKKISIWVLGIIGDKNLIPIFEKLSYSTNEDIQVKSFEALSKMADIQAAQICKSRQSDELVPQAVRAARLCEQMNQLATTQKGSSKSFRKKMVLRLDDVQKKSIKPSHYLSYLNKNLNIREVDQALTFLKPVTKSSGPEKSTKLIEQEKIQTFQLVVDMVSTYEFDSRDLEILKSIVRENSYTLDHCYVNELKNNPTLKGNIKAYFKIVKSGELKQINISESTMKSPVVESCMLQELAKFEFPSLPVDHVNLVYTFSFSPPKQKTTVTFQ
jgi:hypothetical protein